MTVCTLVNDCIKNLKCHKTWLYNQGMLGYRASKTSNDRISSDLSLTISKTDYLNTVLCNRLRNKISMLSNFMWTFLKIFDFVYFLKRSSIQNILWSELFLCYFLIFTKKVPVYHPFFSIATLKDVLQLHSAIDDLNSKWIES